MPSFTDFKDTIKSSLKNTVSQANIKDIKVDSFEKAGSITGSIKDKIEDFSQNLTDDLTGNNSKNEVSSETIDFSSVAEEIEPEIEPVEMEEEPVIEEEPFEQSEEVELEEIAAPDPSLINVDGNMMLDCDPQGIADKFGGQADDSGVYPLAEGDCDNYARGYCLYAQTGEVADFADVGTSGCGLERYTQEASNRKEQAQFVFDRLVNDAKPSIIHVPSSTGNGHWMCVVGVKDGLTRDLVTIGDLIVIDSAGNWGEENSAKIMPCSDNSFYCEEGTENMLYDPGYQVIYYD